MGLERKAVGGGAGGGTGHNSQLLLHTVTIQSCARHTVREAKVTLTAAIACNAQ